MTGQLQRRVERLSRELINCPVGKTKHFTFFVDRNRIVSIGWNNLWKTHPRAIGYRFSSIHSELDAIIRSRRQLIGLTVMNTRLSRGKFAMSQPCVLCRQLLATLEPRSIWYTGVDGSWTKLES